MAKPKTFIIKNRVNAIKRKRRNIEFQSVAGCDVDKDNVVIAVLRRNSEFIDTHIFEQDKIGVRRATDFLLENQVEMVVMESTGSYHNYFYDTFIANGLNAVVINPVLIKALIKSIGKDDAKDAMTMAELALNFELKTSNMPDVRMKRIRQHFRSLENMKVYRTSITNRLHATLRQNSIQVFREVKINSMSGLGILHGIAEGLSPLTNLTLNWFGKKDKIETLLQLFPNSEPLMKYVRDAIMTELQEILRLNERIEQFENSTEDIIQDMGLDSLINLICTVPTMTRPLAIKILGEMGIDFTFRYPTKDKFVCALGLVPKNIISGGKLIKRESTHGNMMAKMAILNMVKTMCVNKGKQNEFRDFYLFYKEKQGKNFMKAVSAVSRKLMVAVYCVVRDGKPYLIKEEREFARNKNKENKNNDN